MGLWGGAQGSPPRIPLFGPGCLQSPGVVLLQPVLPLGLRKSGPLAGYQKTNIDYLCPFPPSIETLGMVSQGWTGTWNSGDQNHGPPIEAVK